MDHIIVWRIVYVKAAIGWMLKKVNVSQPDVFFEKKQVIDFKQENY